MNTHLNQFNNINLPATVVPPPPPHPGHTSFLCECICKKAFRDYLISNIDQKTSWPQVYKRSAPELKVLFLPEKFHEQFSNFCNRWGHACPEINGRHFPQWPAEQMKILFRFCEIDPKHDEKIIASQREGCRRYLCQRRSTVSWIHKTSLNHNCGRRLPENDSPVNHSIQEKQCPPLPKRPSNFSSGPFQVVGLDETRKQTVPTSVKKRERVSAREIFDLRKLPRLCRDNETPVENVAKINSIPSSSLKQTPKRIENFRHSLFDQTIPAQEFKGLGIHPGHRKKNCSCRYNSLFKAYFEALGRGQKCSWEKIHLQASYDPQLSNSNVKNLGNQFRNFTRNWAHAKQMPRKLAYFKWPQNELVNLFTYLKVNPALLETVIAILREKKYPSRKRTISDDPSIPETKPIVEKKEIEAENCVHSDDQNLPLHEAILPPAHKSRLEESREIASLSHAPAERKELDILAATLQDPEFALTQFDEPLLDDFDHKGTVPTKEDFGTFPSDQDFFEGILLGGSFQNQTLFFDLPRNEDF